MTSRLKIRVSGFTLIEILVASAIFLILLTVVISALSQASSLWQRSMGKIESFQDARLAFDSMTRNLSQATMNSYLGYDSMTNPTRYIRQSDLRFLIGDAGSASVPGTPGTGQAVFFLAPLGYSTNATNFGAGDLLNTCGYFVTYTTNVNMPPHASGVSNPYRYRLNQLLAPTEQNNVYDSTGSGWFTAFASQARPMADNIVALIIRPRDPQTALSTAPNNAYTYDSTYGTNSSPQPITANQLPPVIDVTMIAIDESSARRLENGSTPPSVITSALANRFTTPSLYESDLQKVTSALAAGNIAYRVFSSSVAIRESKWSK